MTAALDELPVEQRLLAKRENGVGHIIFNNPAKRNAVSLDMWERLTALLKDYAADPDLKVLVISGAGGKAFVSGADISKFESQRSSKEAVAHYSVTGAKGYEAVYNFPKPTIAKIQGYCIGGGCNLAVCCDIRVATEDARFGIPAAKLGLGYGYTAVRRLAEIIGVSNAMGNLLHGQADFGRPCAGYGARQPGRIRRQARRCGGRDDTADCRERTVDDRRHQGQRARTRQARGSAGSGAAGPDGGRLLHVR